MNTTLFLILATLICVASIPSLRRAVLRSFKPTADATDASTSANQSQPKGPYFKSNRSLGLLLRANPMSYELGIDLRGIYLIKPSWLNFRREKFFYPLSMVKLVNITEYFGKVAKVNILLDHSGTNIELAINRFFPISDAQKFHRLWAETFNVVGNI